jgi:hypothetical protein
MRFATCVFVSLRSEWRYDTCATAVHRPTWPLSTGRPLPCLALETMWYRT